MGSLLKEQLIYSDINTITERISFPFSLLYKKKVSLINIWIADSTFAKTCWTEKLIQGSITRTSSYCLIETYEKKDSKKY